MWQSWSHSRILTVVSMNELLKAKNTQRKTQWPRNKAIVRTKTNALDNMFIRVVMNTGCMIKIIMWMIIDDHDPPCCEYRVKEHYHVIMIFMIIGFLSLAKSMVKTVRQGPETMCIMLIMQMTRICGLCVPAVLTRYTRSRGFVGSHLLVHTAPFTHPVNCSTTITWKKEN